MSRLRRRITAIQAEEEQTHDQNQQQAEQLTQEFSDCKNEYGKISPLVIVVKRNKQELEGMQSVQQLQDFVIDKISEYNQQFKDAGVTSDIYDTTSDKYIVKMKNNFMKKKNPVDALMYLYNAVLKGDNLGRDREKASSVEASLKQDIDFTAILSNKLKLEFVADMLKFLSK